jgi:ribosomal protein S18 acetylase RimI-like enzyme
MTSDAVFTLRPEVQTDAAFRFALFRASRGPGWEQLPLPPDLMAKIMAQQFQAQIQAYGAAYPDARLEIVMVEALPVGRLATNRGSDSLHLIDIALTPAWRGRGVGGAILQGLMDEAGTLGKPLTLLVDRDNRAAQRFYERLGFDVTAADDTHLVLAWPAPAAVMAK